MEPPNSQESLKKDPSIAMRRDNKLRVERTAHCTQLMTLLKKNARIEWRYKLQFLSRFLIPLGLLLLLSIVNRDLLRNPSHDAELKESCDYDMREHSLFVLRPSGEFGTKVESLINNIEWIDKQLLVTYVATPAQLYGNLSQSLRSLAIEFHPADSITGSDMIERPLLNYTMTLGTRAEKFCQGSSRLSRCLRTFYLTGGYVCLKHQINQALAVNVTRPRISSARSSEIVDGMGALVSELPDIGLTSLKSDPFDYFVKAFPSFVAIAFIGFVSSLTSGLIEEKTNKTKEILLVMGLRKVVYWESWFITQWTIFILMSAVSCAAIKWWDFLRDDNVVTCFVFMSLYTASLLAICGIFASLMNSKIAGPIVLVACGGLMAPYYIFPLSGDVDIIKIMLISLSAPSALMYGLEELARRDYRTFSEPQLCYSVNSAIMMLAIDIVLYLLIIAFIERANKIGGEKDWFWFLKPRSRKYQITSADETVANSIASNPNMEPVAPEFRNRSAIQCRNISKIFGSNIAVDKLTLDIYEGQITAILGHNGAGKSTLISMLVGMASTSDGTANIYGNDITDLSDMNNIRSFTGVCFQDDVLFADLTIREHLAFYGAMKGLSNQAISAQSEELIRVARLTKQADSLAGTLSGGEKRKLSICNALLGNPKVVFLDEPSSAVDAYSRQEIWHILRAKKKDRVIILTTHFMDEADQLADRKAIISAGKVKCVGSSLFLKNRFGVGYHLIVVRDKGSTDPAPIVSLITGQIASASLKRTTKTELHFSLPWDKASEFAALFEALEAQSGSGKLLESFAVSVTTMEEVFIKITEESNGLIDSDEAGEKGRPSSSSGNKVNMGIPNISSADRNISFWSQVASLIRVRFLLNSRNRGHLLGTFLIPAFLLWIQWSDLSKSSLDMKDLAPSEEDVRSFRPPSTPEEEEKELEKQSNEPPLTCPLLENSPVSVFESPTVSIRYATRPANADATLHGLITEFPSKIDLKLLNFGDGCISYPNRRNLTLKVPATKEAAAFELDLVMDNLFPSDYPVVTDWMTNVYIEAFRRGPGNTNPNVPIPLYSSRTQIINCKSVEQEIEQELGVHFFHNHSAEISTLSLIFYMSLIFVWIPSYIATEVIEDRNDGIRSYLKAQGVFPSAYWLATYLFHLFWCLFALFVILTYHELLLHLPYVIYERAFLAFVATSVLYFNCAILFVYLISFLFSSKEYARFIIPFLGTVGTLIVLIRYNGENTLLLYPEMLPATFSEEELEGWRSGHIDNFRMTAEFVEWNVWYAPFAANTLNMMFIMTGARRELSYDMIAKPLYIVTTYWSHDIMTGIKAMLILSAIYIFFIALADHLNTGGTAATFFRRGGVNVNSLTAPLRASPDEEINAERARARQLALKTPPPTIPLLMAALRKVYPSSLKYFTCGCIGGDLKVAVDRVDLAVDHAEILGFLGPNGAGKTSAMRMVTGEVNPSEGVARISGHDVTTSGAASFQALGYCPQLDPLWKAVTVREHLLIHGKLKGLDQQFVEPIADLLLKELEIEKHAYKNTSDISGGTKRKLSFAISLIGNPQLLLLDEPSTGLDPLSKRYMWRSIINFVEEKAVGSELDPDASAQNATVSAARAKSQHSAILTTHSMEEAEFLCSRIGIMVNGALRCLGSVQHLNSKYGGGYYLDLKWDATRATADFGAQLIKQVSPLFGGKQSVKEQLGDRMTIFIPPEAVPPLSRVFSTLEGVKGTLTGFEEYAFSQGSFEKVFLYFAKQQLGADKL